MHAATSSIAGAASGTLVGALVDAGIWHGVLPMPQGAMVLVATPGAYVVSWMTGWSLHQESGIACYVFGGAITVMLVLASIGGAAGALIAKR